MRLIVSLSNMRWKASKCVFFTGQCRWVHCREKFSLDMSKGQQQISAAVKIPNAELHSEISFTDNFRREKGHRKRFFRPLFSRNELDHFNDPGIRKSGHGWIHNFEGDFKGDLWPKHMQVVNLTYVIWASGFSFSRMEWEKFS